MVMEGAPGPSVMPAGFLFLTRGSGINASPQTRVRIGSDGSFTVFSGLKSAVVETASYGHRKLYSVESPEVWFVEWVRQPRLKRLA